jgi:L-iditol 2-dehydrogenase
VLVIGCGISGLLHINLAAGTGAGKIFGTDISDFRLQSALRFGADHAFPAADFSPELLRQENDGRLADIVILTTGAPSALTMALDCLERGGTLLVFAPTDHGYLHPLNVNKVFWKTDATITTTYAGSPADHYQALDLIAAGRVNVEDMITHVLPLDRTAEGFALVEKGDRSIKVIVLPHQSS